MMHKTRLISPCAHGDKAVPHMHMTVPVFLLCWVVLGHW